MQLNENISEFGFHQGKALAKIAGYYPTVHEVILEAVQNAIDGHATTVWLSINQKSRSITVRDNGDGVTRQFFDQALVNVCNSGKAKDKLGQFGIGLISPLGKCSHFTFTTIPNSEEHGFLEWTFNSDVILNQKKIAGIPVKPKPEICFSGSNAGKPVRGQTAVKWRSEVYIYNFVTDRIISRISLESLTGDILTRYGAPMRKRKVKIVVSLVDERGVEEKKEISANEFAGKKLNEVSYENAEGGQTTFKMFVSKKVAGKRLGKVLLGTLDNDFRVNASTFSRTAIDFLPEEVRNTLTSGVFEGEILSEKAQMHTNRLSFVKDDAFIGLCMAIETWYTEVGKKYLHDIKEEKQEERYQDLGLKSMKALEGLLKTNEHLRKIFFSFKFGTVGKGHTEPNPNDVVDTQDGNALARNNPTKSHSEERKERRNISGAKEDHKPLSVLGPKGQQRRRVKSDSLGLQFSHEPMEGSSRLWDLDTQEGVLHFNIRHPYWVTIEHSDPAILRLQDMIVILALTLETMPVDYRPFAELFAAEIPGPYVYMIQEGGASVGRKTKKATK